MGFTLEDLRVLSGISTSELHKIESNERRIRLSHLQSLGPALSLSLEDLAKGLEFPEAEHSQIESEPVRSFTLIHLATRRILEDGAKESAKEILFRLPLRDFAARMLRDVLDPRIDLLSLDPYQVGILQDKLREIYGDLTSRTDSDSIRLSRLIGHTLSRIGLDEHKLYLLRQSTQEDNVDKMIPLVKGLILGGYPELAEAYVKACKLDDKLKEKDREHLNAYYGCNIPMQKTDWNPAIRHLLNQLGTATYEHLKPCVFFSLNQILEEPAALRELEVMIREDSKAAEVLISSMDEDLPNMLARDERDRLWRTIAHSHRSGKLYRLRSSV